MENRGDTIESSGAEDMSSLDRFIMARGMALSGGGDLNNRLRVMGILGGVYSGIASVEVLISLFLTKTEGFLPLIFQGGAFGLTAAILLSVRAALKRRARQTAPVQTTLTPEARDMLLMLLNHLQRATGSPFGHRARMRRSMAGAVLPMESTHRSRPLLAEETFELLERAAYEANRLYAVLTESALSKHPALQKLAPAALAATDEAMASILHTAALIERFPESAPQRREGIETQTAELRELAEQIETMASAAPAAIREGAEISRIQTVLQGLRAEQRALAELNEPSSYSAPVESEDIQQQNLAAGRE